MTIDPDNFKDCLARIAARGSMGQKEALAILEHVSDRADKMRQTGQMDPFVYAAGELAGKLRDAAKEDRIDAIRNAKVRAERFAEITVDGLPGAIGKLRSLLYWTPGNDPKGNIQTLGKSLANDWASVMHAKLKQAGLVKAAASKDYFARIADELWNLRAGTESKVPAADPARRIAEIVAPVLEAVKNRLNSEGAKIADAKDYAAHTAHDPFLLRRGGRGQSGHIDADAAFAKWWATAEPKLAEKTFDDVVPGDDETDAQARARFGRSVWEALVTGIRKPMPGEPEVPGGYVPPAFEGSRNLASKLSEGRVLFWKDAASWSDYMARYGEPQSMYELAAHTITQGGRQAASMHFLGTNPGANFDLLVRKIQTTFRSDVDGVNKFSQDLKGSLIQPDLHNVMAQLDGSANVPANQLYHTIGVTVRTFYDMVYLGFVAGTHAGSVIGTFPSEARFHGVNAFSALGNVAKAIIPDWLKSSERAGLLSDLGAYGDGVSREAFNSFGHGWNLPGLVAAAHQRFMTATGLPYLFNHVKAGMREMLSHNLGRQTDTAFDGLEPHLQKLLGLYHIGQQDWELLRSAGILKVADGKTYMTPRNAFDIDAGKAEALLRARGVIGEKAGPGAIATAVDKYRRDISDNLMMYFEDAADHSVVTSGVRERAMLKGSSRPGSLSDEVLSSLLQFKTWPIAAMHQVVGRELFQSLSAKDAAWGLGGVIGLSMLGGYLRMTARDLAYGETPRVPRNIGEAAKIGAASLAQGGGLGIFGDFLFGEANRFGASNLSSFGGPIGTDASQLYGIYNRWLQSIGTAQQHDVWPALARFGITHIPFANLFYLKGALDYMAWYHMFEAMNPGWWERTNRRMAREEGRTMLGYAPGAGVPFVPWGQGEAQAYVAR